MSIRSIAAGAALGLLLQACAAPPAPEATRVFDHEQFARANAAYRVADFDTAFAEYQPLAEDGMAAAQFRLGTMYENGRGVARDLREAAAWYARAAEQRYTGAAYSLGYVRYLDNDTFGAISAWREAAAQKSPQAMYGLGVVYAEGLAVPRDRIKAFMWYDLAAEHGAADAAEKRDALARSMSAAEVADARRRAQAWKADASQAL